MARRRGARGVRRRAGRARSSTSRETQTSDSMSDSNNSTPNENNDNIRSSSATSRRRGMRRARGRGGRRRSRSAGPSSEGSGSRRSASAGGGRRGGPNSPVLLNDADTICPICHNQITSLCITNCNHRFCRNCIRRWTSRNATCPTCRTNIHTIRNILPDGGTEIILISRAELLAHKVNEIHTILMILFRVMSHSLLPEVSNYLDQLNQIAQELNVPTTSSRMENAAAAAAVAEEEMAQQAPNSPIAMARARGSPATSLNRRSSIVGRVADSRRSPSVSRAGSPIRPRSSIDDEIAELLGRDVGTMGIPSSSPNRIARGLQSTLEQPARQSPVSAPATITSPATSAPIPSLATSSSNLPAASTTQRASNVSPTGWPAQNAMIAQSRLQTSALAPTATTESRQIDMISEVARPVMTTVSTSSAPTTGSQLGATATSSDSGLAGTSRQQAAGLTSSTTGQAANRPQTSASASSQLQQLQAPSTENQFSTPPVMASSVGSGSTPTATAAAVASSTQRSSLSSDSGYSTVSDNPNIRQTYLPANQSAAAMVAAANAAPQHQRPMFASAGGWNIVLGGSRPTVAPTTTAAANNRGQQAATASIGFRPSVFGGRDQASYGPPTAEELARTQEQRQRDIRFLTDSYNKINQVYEVLMIMHMVIHRNQVELDPLPPSSDVDPSSEN